MRDERCHPGERQLDSVRSNEVPLEFTVIARPEPLPAEPAVQAAKKPVPARDH